MTRIGIVGHEAAKFGFDTEVEAREIIRRILKHGEPGNVVVSGHCHLGGIDIWAEDEADRLGVEKLIFPPKSRSWSGGFKKRNEQIAENSDEIHVIVVKSLPEWFKGRRHKLCYHCNTISHVKSGACWTAKFAQSLGKPAYWHEI